MQVIRGVQIGFIDIESIIQNFTHKDLTKEKMITFNKNNLQIFK